MSKFVDLTGKRFGRLTVIERAKNHIQPSGQSRPMWLCKCDCGNDAIICSSHLKIGKTKSCGCYVREIYSKIHKTHGKTNTRLYRIWNGMKQRCCYVKDKRYENYGGRGIAVCDEWKNNFEKFYGWAIENGYSESLTIDRINNDGNYEPNNCRWISNKQQQSNRQNNRHITLNGETKTVTQWCEIFSIDIRIVYSRIKSGWGICKALKTPIIKKGGI